MKQEIAKLWIEDLRSGKHVQGRHALMTKEWGFCCLGRLCDIHSALSNDPANSWTPNLEEIPRVYKYLGAGEWLPNVVQEWAGIRSPTGELTLTEVGGDEGSLAELNDNGKTFLEIADIIEQNWELL